MASWSRRISIEDETHRNYLIKLCVLNIDIVVLGGMNCEESALHRECDSSTDDVSDRELRNISRRIARAGRSQKERAAQNAKNSQWRIL